MDKAQKLKDRLQASVDFAIEQKEDMDVSSWNYQEGILLTPNEAKLVIDLVKKLTIPIVVSTSKCDCIHSGSCRYEEVILETKDICRHKE